MPVELNINNVPITFPFEPYEVQKEYMTKVIDCLQNGKHGMLESPTGTGKTLSLLCSTLAWVSLKVDELNTSGESLDGKFHRPQIIYSSRTHTQLTQAIAELRRSNYAYVNTAVIGSRDQLCIHPTISQETNPGVKVSKCRAAVKNKSCSYQKNVESTRNNPVFHEEILDIEDLVKVGEKLGTCPYYMARDLKTRADIVFMPYQYLLDVCTRKRLELVLENCVVILDEGHNVEKMCEESASFELSWSELSTFIEELSKIIDAFPMIVDQASEPPLFTIPDLVYLQGVMCALRASIDKIVLLSHDQSAKFDGQYIYNVLERSQINSRNFATLDNLILRVTDWINTNEGHALRHIAAGLDRFQNFLHLMFYVNDCSFEEHKKMVTQSYKVFVTLESKSRMSDWQAVHDKPVNRDAKVVNFWCFNPAFGMQSLLKEGIRSIIITSGTLSPLQPLISELGIPIDVTLESGHVVTKEQVFVGVLEMGPDRCPLNSSFKTRDDPSYIQSLGRTILNVSRLIPHGLLVFFPSYAVMNKCQDAWVSSGLWDSINKSKEICVEPRNKRDLKEEMNRYYAKNAEPGSKGACFMAVCRGKVSEGLDFIDHNGRGVIITGLPYPPYYDPKVTMKREYMNESKKRVSGYQWYQLEATRAVNQAIGRVIRHKDDYGAILFCDERFSGAGIRKDLSRWLRDQVRVHSSYSVLPRPIALFFKFAKETLPQPPIVAPLIIGENLDYSDCSDGDAYGDVSIKNLHQYQENYLVSKRAWSDKRNFFGRSPAGKRICPQTTSTASPVVSRPGKIEIVPNLIVNVPERTSAVATVINDSDRSANDAAVVVAYEETDATSAGEVQYYLIDQGAIELPESHALNNHFVILQNVRIVPASVSEPDIIQIDD